MPVVEHSSAPPRLTSQVYSCRFGCILAQGWVHSRACLGAFSRRFGCILAQVWVQGAYPRLTSQVYSCRVSRVLGAGCRVQGAGLMVLDFGLRV